MKFLYVLFRIYDSRCLRIVTAGWHGDWYRRHTVLVWGCPWCYVCADLVISQRYPGYITVTVIADITIGHGNTGL